MNIFSQSLRSLTSQTQIIEIPHILLMPLYYFSGFFFLDKFNNNLEQLFSYFYTHKSFYYLDSNTHFVKLD